MSKKVKVDKSFSSGLCHIYKTKERQLCEEIGCFYFQDETIGIKAFSELYVVGTKTDRIISIPFNTLIDNAQAVRIDDVIYQIELIQIKDTFPKSLRLTLTRSPFVWSNIAN